MPNYIKSLEDKNDELQKRLANAETHMLWWLKEVTLSGRIVAPQGIVGNCWYLMLGKSIILSVVHYVQDVKVDGYKICILETPISFASVCNVESRYRDFAICGTLEEAQKICEDKILKG